MSIKLFLLGVVLPFLTCSFFAQQTRLSKGDWQIVSESEIPQGGTRYIKPTDYKVFELSIESMAAKLVNVKRLSNPAYVPISIEIPRPDGTIATFEVSENETMSAGLAEKFHEIRSFDGKSLDGTGEIAKFDFTPQGFHAMILIPGGSTIYLDPYAHLSGNLRHYIVYDRAHFESDDVFRCHFENQAITEVKKDNEVKAIKSIGNCTKRVYRLAMNCTGEYTTFHGGTVALALAATVTSMNRVNGLFMRDLAVTMSLVPNNDQIIYTNSLTDPFTNGDVGALNTESHANGVAVIGWANFDIGHVFGTDSGGAAGLGVVCDSLYKGSGATGSSTPIGDPFDIDYVAHEIGHQFSGNHTFAGCGGNINVPTAVEPGSGSTIMAYAGICGSPNDVQPNSDDHFQYVNMDEIHTFLNDAGNSCAISTVIVGQSAPTVTVAGGAYNIPISTPFALTASATDPDGDVLTYCWEQVDTSSNVIVPIASQTSGPNFRSRLPSLNPTRYFPAIGGGGPFEVLPSVARTMTFKCLVRDNELGGGCNDDATVTYTTVASAGPFVVNYPTNSGISVAGNSTMTVTWSVNNTNVAPVACTNVDVLISTDNGLNWTVIGNNVSNDGSEIVTIPNTSSTQALIMVMCANGTFYDISNNVFTIIPVTNDYTFSLTTNSISTCEGNDATFTINIGQIGSFGTVVNLSASGLPAAAVASFSPANLTPVGSSVLSITTSGVVPGIYPFTITANASGSIKQVSASLSISSSTISPSLLITPINNASNQAIVTNLSWSNLGFDVFYTVEIATDNSFSTIIETATGLNATNYTATSLNISSEYFWRVKAYNSCATAVSSTIYRFITGNCFVAISSDVPKAISGAGTPTITSVLNIAQVGTIDDLDIINLSGSHTYMEDLSLTITSPLGTTATLFGGICSGEDNFDLEFDDASPTNVIPCPPITGLAYQPSSLLSVFNGTQIAGTWTLTITDAVDVDGGSLNSWGLSVCTTPTGVEIVENSLVATVYPNPTSALVTIQFPNETTLETIIVTDVTGRIIHSDKNPTSSATYLIDLAKEAKGIYYVNLSTSGTKQTLRLIKQ